MNLRHSSAAEECRLEIPEGVLHLFALVLRLQQGSPDLTQQPALARLEDAAELVENASLVSRAEVAELADAHGSGPCTRKGVGVRVPSSAPSHSAYPNKINKSCMDIGDSQIRHLSTLSPLLHT